MQVPAQYDVAAVLAQHRGRHDLAPARRCTLAPGTGVLGYEWDEDVDNGFRPAGADRHVVDDRRRAGRSPTTATPPRTTATRRTTSPVPGAVAARWCSARARCNGRGVSTRSTRRASPPTSTCSRRPSTCWPTCGVQPSTLDRRSRGRDRVDRHHRADLDDHRPGVGHVRRGRHRASRIHGTATDTGGGVVGRGRGLDRRRHDLAPGDRARRSWTYSWTAARQSEHGHPHARVDDSANVESPRPGNTVNVDVPVLDLGAERGPDEPRLQRRPRHRARRAVHERRGRDDLRRSASTRRRPTPARTSATSGPTSGQLLGTATFANEIGVRLATGQLPDPDRDRRQHQLRRRLSRAVGSLLRGRGLLLRSTRAARLRRGASTARRCTRCTTRRPLPNGLFKYSSTPTFPTNTFNAENYWVDVVYSGSGTHCHRARSPDQRHRDRRATRSRT